MMTNKVLNFPKLRKHSPQAYFLQMADLHIQEIKSGFLTTLGQKFLERLYHCISTSKHSFAFAAVEDEKVVGFICGCTNTKGLYLDFAARYGMVIFPHLLPKFLNVGNLKKAFETFGYPQKVLPTGLPEPEILNFCVKNTYQRKGIGSALFNCLVKKFYSMRVDAIRIITSFEQKNAQQFYGKKGAQLVGSFELHKNVNSLIYIFPVEKC